METLKDKTKTRKQLRFIIDEMNLKDCKYWGLKLLDEIEELERRLNGAENMIRGLKVQRDFREEKAKK